ncbi:MAG: winged helix-turn-helix domain-containing protein [Anaerolineae bacterium]
MQLPETSDLLLPILNLLSEKGEFRLRQIVNSLAEEFEINENEEFEGSSSDAQFYSRVVGARSYLTHAKLIENPKRGVSVISKRGEELLAEKPEEVTLKTLTRYPEFVSYLNSDVKEKAPVLEKPYATSDSVESELAVNGNRYDAADNSNSHFSKLEDKEDLFEQSNGIKMDPQRATPIDSINGKAAGENNAVILSPENFTTTLELFEQLKVSSKLKQDNYDKPTLVAEKVEGLSPALFAILSLMRFLENMFQNIWLYLIPFILMMLAYAASFFILSDEFVSRGVMFVQTDTLINQVSSIGEDNFAFFLSPSEQTAEEITELLNTDSFIRLIIQETPLEAKMAEGDKTVRETISDVRDSIYVGITGSNNVEVRASWDDREVAWKTATATMNSFIEWKISSDKRDSFAAREFLEQLVPQYENERLGAVQNLETYLIQHPEPFRGDRPEIEQLQIEQLRQAVETADTRYQDASDNLEQIRLEEVIVEGKTRQSYNIVDSPSIPVEEEGGLLRKIITASIFIVLGIVLSVLAIISTTLLDRSIRFPIETPSSLGLPVLSTVKTVPNIEALTGE